MECPASRILITGYIDDELSADEIQQLKTHLNMCEACVGHLRKMEQMKTAFKHYQLIQEVPTGSPHFARQVSRIIHSEAPVPSRQSLILKALQQYRAFVLRFVESWISSLRARPVTWVTSVSCILMVILGVAFIDVSRMLSFQSPSHFAILPESEQHGTSTDITYEEASPAPVVTLAFSDETDNETAEGLPEFIKFSDDAVVHVAQTTPEPVNNYVYSHVVEASQGQFLDSAVFAGYVQDAIFQ